MLYYTNPDLKESPDIIYTMRHVESDGNARGLDDNSLKNVANHQFELTDKGYEQLSLSADYIFRNRIIKSKTGLYTSNFLRAQKSMGGILKNINHHVDVKIDSRLDEWWRGIFHSLSDEDIDNYYPLEKKIQEREGRHHYRPPQGQAGKDVEINLISFLRDIYDKEIFIVGHGRSLGFLRRLITNQRLRNDCDYSFPKNGEIWKFVRNGICYEFESLFVPNVIENDE